MLSKQLSALPEEIEFHLEIIHSPKKTDELSIIAFMNDGNEVHATLRTFAEKMQYYPALVKQLEPDQKGIIDMEVGTFFKSFDSDNGDVDIEERREESES